MPLLVVLGYVWPEPDSSAAGRRMLSLLQMFRQQEWRIIFASPAEQGPHRFDLTAWQIEEQQIRINDSQVDAWLAQLQPDIVLFDRFMLEEQFGWRVEKACPAALRVLDTEDLHCLRDIRQRRFHHKNESDDLIWNTELAQREIAAILRCDISLIISEVEMALLQQHYQVPATQLLYCPFLIEEHARTPLFSLLPMQQRHHFVTMGNFRHEPNWQSVLWLYQEIWPLIRAQLPQAELHIYGAYPPPKATSLHAPRQGFFMKGWADDAHQVFAKARVCLAPLPFGAGLKGKFIDAMQTGTPVVTTEVGAEGMQWQGQWCGLIAEDPAAIAAAAIRLYQEATLWQQAQQTGFAILQEKFSAEHFQPLIWQRLNELRQHVQLHRQQHFLGAMLRYHHHRSTRFMGQWIEAKNQLAELKMLQKDAD